MVGFLRTQTLCQWSTRVLPLIYRPPKNRLALRTSPDSSPVRVVPPRASPAVTCREFGAPPGDAGRFRTGVGSRRERKVSEDVRTANPLDLEREAATCSAVRPQRLYRHISTQCADISQCRVFSVTKVLPHVFQFSPQKRPLYNVGKVCWHRPRSLCVL